MGLFVACYPSQVWFTGGSTHVLGNELRRILYFEMSFLRVKKKKNGGITISIHDLEYSMDRLTQKSWLPISWAKFFFLMNYHFRDGLTLLDQQLNLKNKSLITNANRSDIFQIYYLQHLWFHTCIKPLQKAYIIRKLFDLLKL